MLVGLNEKGLVQDFYFPFVGQSNMTNARQVEHKIGLSLNGNFTWVGEDGWEVECSIQEDSLIGVASYKNKNIDVELRIISFVDIYDDVFCRKVEVINRSNQELKAKVFFHQVFQISANGRADTAMYVPSKYPYILSYRGNTALALSLKNSKGIAFNEYAVGVYDLKNHQGTYKDAEDSELSNNAVEHGSVDSTISSEITIDANSSEFIDYWVCLSNKNYHFASKLHRVIASAGIDEMHKRTESYWKSWLNISNPRLVNYSDDEKRRINLSLMVVKAHVDERGGVLASSDSSIFNYGKDYYSYVWPRDAAHSLIPLIRLGHTSEAMQYFKYVERTMHPKGYMHQKYQPDGGLGSTWHPMVQNGKPELNIQEDETASTVLLFFELARHCQDKDFLSGIYENVVVKMLNFMAGYINHATGLPYPSYDLWEEKFLTTTYTSILVAEALEQGASYGGALNEGNKPIWDTTSRIIRSNIAKLFSADDQYFAKGLSPEINGVYEKDTVIDISTLYALFKYGHYNHDHMAVISTANAVVELISNKSPSGGVVRYQKDKYMLSKDFVGNPWHVCTLWLAQYYIWAGKVQEAEALINWTYKHCLPSGIMSEQIDPENGEEIGVAPLVWSHAELINTLLDYKQRV
jgi:GH15 family glucan-1,4-alpha-glucosidase